MRIQLDLPPAKVERMKELMEDLGVETYKELFNNALALLDWSVEQVQDKRVIAGLLVNENSYRELVMPALQNAAHDSRHNR